MGQLNRLNRYLGLMLGPRPTLWLRKLRHGELSWQRRFTGSLATRSRKRRAHRTPRAATNHTLARGYDALRITRANLAWVREQLEALGLEYVELPH